MSDWVLSDENPTNINNGTPAQSDWQLDDSEPQEEGFWSKMPRNIAIGLTHAGRNLHNLPHDLVQGFENATAGIGKAFDRLPVPKLSQGNPISSYLPYDTNNYADVFGQKGAPTPADQLIQKGTEYAPDVLSGLNALRSMKLLPHLTKYGATKKLNKAQKLAQERDIGTMNINPELIKDIKQFLPDILRNREALDASHAGDYNSLFRLQSDVGKISQARMGKIRSLFAPESAIKGRAGLESRSKLLNALREDLRSQGHHDIADLMKKGQDEYRRYMKFKPYINKVAGAAALYALPKNALIDLAQKLFFHRGE